GHPDIQQDQIRPSTQARRPRLRGVFGKLYCVSFIVKNLGQELTDTNFVVNNQDSGHKASPTYFFRIIVPLRSYVQRRSIDKARQEDGNASSPFTTVRNIDSTAVLLDDLLN